MEIDLGARDGVRTNLPVLTADGLVGRMQSVGQTRSQVILLGDPDLRVAAVVAADQRRNRRHRRQFLQPAGKRHGRSGLSFGQQRGAARDRAW